MLLNNILSVRAYNVCKKNHLSSIPEMMEYYKKYGTFRNLPHCGQKSNKELIEFCEDIKTLEEPLVEKTMICDTSILKKLEESDVDAINRYIENETKVLSQRSTNAIVDFLSNRMSLEGFCENIFGNPDFQVMKLHNIGKSSIDEITSYLDNIEGFIQSVYLQKA